MQCFIIGMLAAYFVCPHQCVFQCFLHWSRNCQRDHINRRVMGGAQWDKSCETMAVTPCLVSRSQVSLEEKEVCFVIADTRCTEHHLQPSQQEKIKVALVCNSSHYVLIHICIQIHYGSYMTHHSIVAIWQHYHMAFLEHFKYSIIYYGKVAWPWKGSIESL